MTNHLHKQKELRKSWEYYYFIYNILEEACKYIKIPIPKIEVVADHDNCHADIYNNKIIIGLDSFSSTNFWTIVARFLPINFTNEKERIRFGVYHELGHFIQYIRHRRWYKFFEAKDREIKDMLPDVEDDKVSYLAYRKLKTQRNADKIALILFKKFNQKESD
jgi:hypothetical protein